MRNHIAAYQLINFQSWDASTKAIYLESDMVNIIEGANETGKSVLYKVLYNFAFPGYWDPKELIRRGCSMGVLLLELSNKHCIVFQLEHKHHTYILVDGEKELVWKDCALPQEIIDDMGLILDYEQRVILNVVDKDISLPFIKTSPKFNASLIKARVEPPDITDFFSSLDELQKQVSTACISFASKTREVKAAADIIKFTDVDELLIAKERVDTVYTIAKNYSDIEDALRSLASDLTTAPKSVVNPEKAGALLEIYDKWQDLAGALFKHKTLLGSSPSEVPNPLLQQASVKLYKQLQDLTTILNSHACLVASKPSPILHVDLSKEIKVLAELDSIKSALRTLIDEFSTCKDIRKHSDQIASELENIRKETGVCPTCGRLLDNKHI